MGIGTPTSGPPVAGPSAIPGMPQPAPNRPKQSDIDTAAAIIEKCLEIVTDDEHSDEAVKLAVKDVLLPGRGTCRVRWRPKMISQAVMAGDGLTPLPGPDGTPQTQDVKIWEEVGDEYVYWEDMLVDPVRASADTNWISFRHLFTRESLETEFAGSAQYDRIKAANRLSDLFKWTDESAAKYPVGGGAAMKTANKLGDYIKKAMVWEIWDRRTKTIIWFMRECGGVVLRVDPDSYQLDGFFPTPVPMLSVRTSDSRIPVPFYDTYAKLAADLDETSSRISDMTKKIKATGAYNAANKDVADLLLLDDGKMIGVEGVDMLGGGLQNHIWMRPIDIYVAALQQLYLARNQIKESIYEIMGISDIMRGSTVPTETATAQRIKTTMGVNRLQDNKDQVANFCTDLMRLKSELICKNFDAATLEGMTGEKVTPEVMAILRSDFMRTCSVDIESESTVTQDIQEEQQAMAMVVQSMTAVMQGAQGMLQSGILPPDKVILLSLEMLKMLLHPVRYSRPVIEMIDDFQEQLEMQAAIAAIMPPPPQPLPPPGPPGAPSAPPGGPARHGAMHPRPVLHGGGTGGPPTAMNGGPPPAPPAAPPPGAQSMQ